MEMYLVQDGGDKWRYRIIWLAFSDHGIQMTGQQNDYLTDFILTDDHHETFILESR
jgi:hypothetical protein